MTLIEKLIQDGYERKKAQSLIMSGNVLVNEEVIIVGSTKINNNSIIRIKNQKEWVSRGAYKLIEAINKFNLNVENKVCLDVGASTGGFTEVLLNFNAKKVYALDVGTNQLDFSLRANPKVISLEKINLKSINQQLFTEEIDFLCCDVSFISVKKLFEVLSKCEILSPINDIVVLIKPQFEAKREQVGERGFVDKKFHNSIISDIVNFVSDLDFQFINLIESPIKGTKSKNTEYLCHFKRFIYEH